MASSEQIREWYHEGVVLNHADRDTPGYEPVCDHDHPTVGIPRSGGGVFLEPVHPLTFEAWQAYVAVMNHHGETITSAGGVNSCRNIGTSDRPSLHAYLCALDSPPNSRKSDAFIADIEKIRTNSGAQVFRNLDGDRMHDQIDCSPADLATEIDWDTVIGYTGDDMAFLSEEAQQFFEEAYQRQKADLDPPTSPSYLREVVNHLRDHPPADVKPHGHDADTTIGESP